MVPSGFKVIEQDEEYLVVQLEDRYKEKYYKERWLLEEFLKDDNTYYTD
jgi:hypothetical protein